MTHKGLSDSETLKDPTTLFYKRERNHGHCVVCGNPLNLLSPAHAKYCSDKCRKEVAQKKFRAQGGLSHAEMPSATTGAIHELIICVELMRKKFHVFRAQSPACPCDLIAMKEDKIYRIEVTTGTKTTLSSYSYPKKGPRYQFDFMAIVFHSAEIVWVDKNYQVIDFPG